MIPQFSAALSKPVFARGFGLGGFIGGFGVSGSTGLRVLGFRGFGVQGFGGWVEGFVLLWQTSGAKRAPEGMGTVRMDSTEHLSRHWMCCWY